MKPKVHLVAMVVVAVLAGVLVPAAASTLASAQEQTSWYVNDDPDLFGPSRYWYWGDPGHGYGSNYYRYTYGIAGASSPDNWARWSMGRRVGRQEIQVYVPSNHATATVTYRINVGGREYTRRVAQRSVSGWTAVGSYDADGARVTITVRDNEASQHHSRHGLAASRIGVDAIRMRCTSRCDSSSPPPPDLPPALDPPPPPPSPPSSSRTSQRSAGGCGLADVLYADAGVVSGYPRVDWDVGCVSEVRGDGGHLARRYGLEVRGAGDVTIELSSEVDTYLILLDEAGGVIVEDDDGGSGTDSRIVRWLPVGTYVVEATTYSAGESGSFTLGVTVAASASPPPSPLSSSSQSAAGCRVVSLGAMQGSVSRDDSWSAGCESNMRSGRYARLFEFSVSSGGEVTIDLESDVDTYLILLGEAGEVLVEDDDGGSGTNSLISTTLDSGTYRVEVTTYHSSATGDFRLRVSEETAVGSSTLAVPTLAVGGDARPSGNCSSVPCRWFRVTNLRPGSRVECWREGLARAFTTFIASSTTSTRNCYFSYVGARVYVVADGVRSNTIIWPPASAESSPPVSSSNCVVPLLGSVSDGEVVSRRGEWAAICESSERGSEYFATDFLFHLPLRFENWQVVDQFEVTIDLTSTDTDTYLYLIDSQGDLVAEDDDGGSGTNSRITTTVNAGLLAIFRVQATTYNVSQAGSFTLRISASPTATSQVDQPPECYDVSIVWARGSGQELGATEAEAYFSLRYQLDTDRSNSYELDYPAVNAGPMTLISTGWVTSQMRIDYDSSITEGWYELFQYVSERASRCPDEIFALGGYSQGAQVVGEALHRISLRNRYRIQHVALFGDPKLSVSGSSGEAGSCAPWRRGGVTCDDANGILGKREPYVPQDMTGAVGSWCHGDDHICAFKWSNLPFSSTHDDYADLEHGIAEAVEEAAGALNGCLAERSNCRRQFLGDFPPFAPVAGVFA